MPSFVPESLRQPADILQEIRVILYYLGQVAIVTLDEPTTGYALGRYESCHSGPRPQVPFECIFEDLFIVPVRRVPGIPCITDTGFCCHRCTQTAESVQPHEVEMVEYRAAGRGSWTSRHITTVRQTSPTEKRRTGAWRRLHSDLQSGVRHTVTTC